MAFKLLSFIKLGGKKMLPHRNLTHRERELHTMPYQEYLQTPEWKARRQAALKRADRCCQVCNQDKTQLNVHHRTYDRRGYERDEDLIVLCRDCHDLFHKQGKLAK